MRRMLIASLFVLPLVPQSVTIPNSSFENGTDAPLGWTLSGTGEWEREGAAGDRSIKATGSGDDSSWWKCDDFILKPSRIYRLTFQARSQNAAGGCAISGPNTLNRDYQIDSFWRTYGYAFKLPDNAADSYLRFGQWHVKGSVLFDDIRLFEVEPLHKTVHGMELGLNEYIRDNTYRFAPVYSGEGANYSRCLISHTAGFNSTRWVMGDGSFIVYRHRVGTIAQASARVRVTIGYYAAGSCIVEASADGTSYMAVGDMNASGAKEFTVPPSLFPGADIYLRLKASASQAAAGESKPGAFQINNYEYIASLASPLADATGDTQFATILVKDASLAVKLISLGTLDTDPVVQFKARAAAAGDYTAVFSAGDKKFTKRFSVKADTVSAVDIPFSVPITEPGIMPVTLAITDAKGTTVYSVSSSFFIDTLSFANFGERITGPGHIGLWWCPATYKIGRTRALPTKSGAVRINAAKNEYESFQVALRPSRDIARMSISASDLTGANGARIAGSNISFARVGYVDVRVPSDPTGIPGLWPDPLEKIRGEFTASADVQNPLWVTVHIPFDAAPGDYTGTMTLSADGAVVPIPISVHVWNFGLPLEPSLKSAFELYKHPVKRYHNLADAAEEKDVMDRYYRDFAEHRISPQNPLRQPSVTFTKDAAGKAVDLTMNFDDFDADGRYYFDTLGFTAFRLSLAGMGSGTFYSRKEGEFGGHKQGSPGYDALWGKYVKAIQDHLEEKGWLSKAYVYWFDEPDVKDYQFVIDGMSLIRKHAPKIRRLLTEDVIPDLAGAVDIWCPHVNGYNELVPDRISAGEEFWWYVCTGPKAPYIGIFIDHPSIDMRIWGWMSWKYGATGILVWAVNWWTSGVAFTNKAQNPWTDAMSYVEGYGYKPGQISYWGNGDGRYLYPANTNYPDDRRRYIDGPQGSVRWDMVRDGIEEYEYFALLKDLVARAKAKNAPPSAYAEAQSLLDVPASIVSNLTEFTKDPLRLNEQRERIAKAMETLSARSALPVNTAPIRSARFPVPPARILPPAAASVPVPAANTASTPTFAPGILYDFTAAKAPFAGWDIRTTTPPMVFSASGENDYPARLIYPAWQSGSTEWPAVVLKLSGDHDFQPYKAVVLDVKNTGSEFRIEYRFDDESSKPYASGSIPVPAGAASIRIPIEKPMPNVRKMHLILTKPKAEQELMLRRIALSKE